MVISEGTRKPKIFNVDIADFPVGSFPLLGLSKSLEEVGIRDDIKDLGLLAFELATGKNLLDYDLMDEDEDINNSNVPTSFVAVCKQAGQFFPDERFDTVDDFLEALNKIG